MEEKRKTVRVGLSFDVAFSDGDELCRCQTLNASQGGLLVGSERRPEVGSVLPLRLEHDELPGPLEVVSAVVRHSDTPPGFGVQITQIQHRSEAAFKIYCDLIVSAIREGVSG